MKRQTILAGFAIFAMFFGSGNIVFPLSLGRVSGSIWTYTMLGFFLTAVLVPFLGLVSVTLLQGKSKQFFRITGYPFGFLARKLGLPVHIIAWVSEKPGILLQLFIMCLLGPFGVIPRCVSVSYGSFKSLAPTFPEIIFAGGFCAILWTCTVNRSKIIPIIGKILTPIKLSLIILLIVLGIHWAPDTAHLSNHTTTAAFKAGLLNGYHTMDLTAAIFFAAAIMGFFSSTEKNHIHVKLKDGFYASLIGASLLTGVYIGFMYLGSAYAGLTLHAADVEILPTIALHTLGSFGGLIFCVTIVFSCLTTAVALTSCWIDTLNELAILPKISYGTKLLATISLVFSMATFFGFNTILTLMGPALEVIYPALIIMAMAHITLAYKAEKQRKIQKK